MINDEYYLWGAGEYGWRMIEFMKFMNEDIHFRAVIDSDPQKQGTQFYGLPVLSYDEVKHELPKVKIIISINIPTQVRAFLLKEGFIENHDFFIPHSFLPLYFRHRDKAVVKNLDFAATTLCNKCCKDCQVFIPFAVNPNHRSTESVMEDVDLAFRHFDVSMTVNICVGESLLNTELPDICRRIYDKYAGRYFILSIQTNGTILPSDDDMIEYAASKVVFAAANYPENAEDTEKLMRKCEKFGVRGYYNVAGGDREIWFDLGNPHIINETDPEKLRDRYLKCYKPATVIYDGWAYACGLQGYAKMTTGVGTPIKGEAFNLRQTKTDTSREELYELLSWKTPEKGYLTHCMRCLSIVNPSSWAKKQQ